MDSIITVSQFLLSLSILIVLHEMGHFLPAKWFKTRVEKFYLFFDFPPFNSLFKIKKGETEYGIGWLPLGGYVKISGMVDESMDTAALKEPPKPWEFRSKPAWQRLIIMLGGVTVNFLLGFFIFGMMLWVYGKSYVQTSELKNGIAFDSVLINQGFRSGDLILKVGDKPFDKFEPGAFVTAMALDENPPVVTVLRDGQEVKISPSSDVANQITGKGLPKGSLMAPRIPFVVDEVVPGKPAAAAKIQLGDRIITFNGEPIPYFDQFSAIAQKHKSQQVTLGILRGADTVNVPLTLTDEGTIGVRTKTDGYFKEEVEKYSFLQAMPAGVKMGVDFLDNQLKAFGQMFRGNIGVKDNLGSLISIGKLYGPTWDWERFWNMTASLSIILAFMNLLPIPALDGGYVMFLLWEVVTRRKVSDAFMEKAVTVGFFLLLGLMVFALGNDIWKHWLQRLF
jgi:regulator of sigma E protease